MSKRVAVSGEESAPKQACTSQSVTILDGGMGHQLKAMGVEISGPIGSISRFLGVAVANTETPQIVRDAHLAYMDAGADVITTNSYACVPKCLELGSADACGECGDSKGEGSDSNLQKYDLAGLVAAAGKRARESCDARPLLGTKVAGALPPLAESYRPDKVGPFDENLKQYKIIVDSIAPFSDLLLCETMSTADEARAAVTAAATTDLPIWVSWTLNEKEPVLRSGESIKDAIEAVKSVDGANLQACLFNCTSPEVITLAIPMLRDLAPGLKIGAYANGFCTAESGCGEYRDLSPEQYYEEFASKWIASGATLVGGCCGVFPRHIAHLKKSLK